jgi:hypothetical protein
MRHGRPTPLARLALVCLLAVLGARVAEARPTYFEVFTARYSIAPSDRTYACGNCHLKWTGTGARNSYGSAVEQQLYVGKSITQALADIEPMDADADGFSNYDEAAVYQTLPGYSCDDFFLADGAPIGYDTFITPLVPSCLEPVDVRVNPTALSYITKAGTADVRQLQIINNGSADPITVSAYGLLAGSHATLSVSGPSLPIVIPVGGVATLDVTFAPPAAVIATGTLRIDSSDPDEPTIDVPIQAFGFVQILAAPEQRLRCLKTIEGQFRRYADRHRREWSRCFLDEVRGLACDAGTRDLKIQQAETRFRDAVGGVKDKVCAGASLNAALLGMPPTCGGGCTITLGNVASIASCLVCRQDTARDDMLRDAIGTAPPDSPPNVAASADANRCEKQIASRIAKGIANVQKLLGRCELGNVGADTPVDCAAVNAGKIAAIQAKVNAALSRCTDTTGLLGCPFEGGTATCLGDAALTIGATLVDATFPDP